MKCANCDAEAEEHIRYISRRLPRTVQGSAVMCHQHTEEERRLSAYDLAVTNLVKSD